MAGPRGGARIKQIYVEVSAQYDQIDKAFKVVRTKTDMLKASLNTVSIASAAVGAALIAVGRYAYNSAKSAGQYAEEMHNLSKETDVSTDYLQRLRYASKSLGLDFQGVAKASTMIQQRLMGVDKDGGNAAEAFARLGVKIRDNSGNMRSMNEMFPEIIHKLQGMTNATERNMLAAQMFGRGWKEVAPIIDMTQAEFDKLTGRATIISPEELEQTAKFQIALNQITMRAEGVTRKFGFAMIPTMERLIPVIQDKLVPAFMNLIKGVASIIEKVASLPTPVITTTAALIGLAMVSGPLLGLVNVLKGVWTFFAGIGPLLTTVIAKWGLLTGAKVADTVATGANTKAQIANAVAQGGGTGSGLLRTVGPGGAVSYVRQLGPGYGPLATAPVVAATTGLTAGMSALAVTMTTLGIAVAAAAAAYFIWKDVDAAREASYLNDKVKRESPGIDKKSADARKLLQEQLAARDKAAQALGYKDSAQLSRMRGTEKGRADYLQVYGADSKIIAGEDADKARAAAKAANAKSAVTKLSADIGLDLKVGQWEIDRLKRQLIGVTDEVTIVQQKNEIKAREEELRGIREIGAEKMNWESKIAAVTDEEEKKALETQRDIRIADLEASQNERVAMIREAGNAEVTAIHRAQEEREKAMQRTKELIDQLKNSLSDIVNFKLFQGSQWSQGVVRGINLGLLAPAYANANMRSLPASSPTRGRIDVNVNVRAKNGWLESTVEKIVQGIDEGVAQRDAKGC